MPGVAEAAFAAVGSALTAAGASATVASIGATLSYVAVTAAYVVGPTLVARNQQKKAAQGMKNAGTIISAKDPAASHKLVYGQVRVGGTVFFIHTKGNDNHEAHILVVHAAHECAAVRKVYLNEQAYDFSDPENDDAVVIWNNKAYIKSHRGYPGQDAEVELVSAAPGYWTSSDKVTGHCYTYARLQWDANVFPTGAPNISVVVDGRKVYDPRDEGQSASDPATWTYSNNAALCILDYLRDSTYGLGCEEDEIDWGAFIAAANTCDESVYGGARYTLNGVVDTAETPREIIERMLTSCAGQLVNMGGVWRLLVGAARTTTAVFTLDHVRGPLSPQCGDSLHDTCNGVKGLYVSAANQWQPSDFVPVTSRVAAEDITADALCTIVSVGTTDFTAIGAASNTVGVTFKATGAGTGTGIIDFFLGQDDGERRWRDVELPFTTNAPTAHRLARIALKRARQDITLPLRLNLAGLAVTVGDVVALPFARYGWEEIGDDGKLFEVRSWKLGYEQTEDGPLPYVDLILREWSDNFFSDDPDTTVDDAPNTTLPDPRVVQTPTGLALSSDSYSQPDGNYYPRLKVVWDVPTDSEFIISGGRARLEYKKHSDSAWIVWNEMRADVGEDYITDAIFGVAYDVRLQFENTFRVRSEYSDSLTDHASGYTLTVDNTEPDTPTGLSAIAGTGKAISLDWDDNSEDDIEEYRIYRSTSSGGTYTLIAETASSRFVDIDVSIGTTYYYKISAIDYFENESALTSAVSATPSTVVGSPDSSAPSNPSAPTLNTAGNYVAGDGTLYARLVINVPSMPSGAAILNILYRRDGTTGWILADQRSAGGGTSSIDDLSPDTDYEIAAQAFSAYGVGSSIIGATGDPFTTPNGLAPSAPTSIAMASGSTIMADVAPLYHTSGAVGTKQAAGKLQWTASVSRDVAFYEITLSGGPDLTPAPDGSEAVGFTAYRTIAAETFFVAYRQMAYSNNKWWVRAVNRSGIPSAWAGNVSESMTTSYGGAGMAEQSPSSVAITGGSISGITDLALADGGTGSSSASGARSNLGLGTIATQASSALEVTGIKTGSSSTTQVKARYQLTHTFNATGGAATENFNVDISGRGFTTAPDIAPIAIPHNDYDAYYLKASSSSSTAVFVLYLRSGANVGAGNFITAYIECIEI